MSSCILVGVAGPARKLGSAPMCAIMQALVDANKNLTIVQMDEEFMLDTCVTCWPTVQVLVTLYAPPFPLDKVLRYVKLRTPVLVNNLYMQRYMMDRRDIRNVLQSAGVPTPNAVIVDRQSGDRVLQSEGGDVLHVYKAGGGCDVILKPFVEKPVDPEDHSKCYSFMACLLLSPFSLLFSQRVRRSLHCKRADGSILTTHECHALRLLTFSDHVVYSFSFFGIRVESALFIFLSNLMCFSTFPRTCHLRAISRSPQSPLEILSRAVRVVQHWPTPLHRCLHLLQRRRCPQAFPQDKA